MTKAAIRKNNMKCVRVVGAGLYGATVARVLAESGVEVLLIEASGRIAGNIADRVVSGVHTCYHGAHIFHTNSERVSAFLLRFTNPVPYEHRVVGERHGKKLPLPFNLRAFRAVMGFTTEEESRSYVASLPKNPASRNVEDWCMSNIGPELYGAYVKDYTEKQWGRPCNELPASIIERLPVRFDNDETYFRNAKFQWMPDRGYTDMVRSMLDHPRINVHLDTSFSAEDYDSIPTFYSGEIDKLLDYQFGPLAYRGLRFEDVYRRTQGTAVINNLNPGDHTRTIEHQQFYKSAQIMRDLARQTLEFPQDWKVGDHPYYPVNDTDNQAVYDLYRTKAAREFPNIIFGGRLGSYRYYDMDQVVAMALKDANDYLKSQEVHLHP
jgi:UDP-galactopyranose mutase